MEHPLLGDIVYARKFQSGSPTQSDRLMLMVSSAGNTNQVYSALLIKDDVPPFSLR